MASKTGEVRGHDYEALPIAPYRPPEDDEVLAIAPFSEEERIRLIAALQLGTPGELSQLPDAEFREQCFKKACVLLERGDTSSLSQASNELTKLDFLGRTLLTEFASRGDLKAVEFLLDKQISILSTDSQGRTPLHLAALEGHSHLVDVLIRFSEVNALAEGGHTPLHSAVLGNQPEVVHELLRRGANVNSVTEWRFGSGETLKMTPLSLAVAFGHKDCVDALLSEPDLDLKVPIFGNVLHVAAHFGGYEMLVYLLDKEAILPLINGTDTVGRTPFAAACYSGNTEVVELLHAYHANIEKPDLQGRTPLHWAVLNGQADVARFLAYHQSRLLKVDDQEGCDPLALAKSLAEKGTVEAQVMFRYIKNLRAEASRGEITPP